ncbi:unnamed protein product [Blepharisma stoltei]|uniref:Pseudouridine synthase I TruA alpha/beta domain-containing protein n=1 Tax=Blepharisma stoltei TaxID=1481888 RepID=A0AAU9K286_9CILI|nr:unnamed protein product [Blepharisma stoltei]
MIRSLNRIIKEEACKRKVALLFAYNGSQFKGSQMQAVEKNLRTVEGVMEQALFQAGCISESNRHDLEKIKWSRVSRTDKGVHAILTIAGVKIMWDNRCDDDMIETINQYLPEDVRIFGIRQVTKSFNAKKYADFRVYEYLFPYHSLFPGERFSTDKINELNGYTRLLEGTHLFHNYSKRLTSDLPESKRYIIKFEAHNDPLHYKGIDFIKFNITGQSFVYHQIRKMLGTSLGILLGKFDKGIIEESFKEPLIELPLAPAEGLALAQQNFSWYNAAQPHKPIKLKEKEEKAIQEFYINSIVNTIYSAENVFTSWCEAEFRTPNSISNI